MTHGMLFQFKSELSGKLQYEFATTEIFLSAYGKTASSVLNKCYWVASVLNFIRFSYEARIRAFWTERFRH